MIKPEKPNRDYEIKLLEAERQLTILEYENYKWLHKKGGKS